MRVLVAIFLALFISVTAFAQVETLHLRPTKDQGTITNVTTTFLSANHYKEISFDDELSADIFEWYIKALDPQRSHFQARDMRLFNKVHRYSLENALQNGNLLAPFKIYETFEKHIREQIVYVRERLEQPFDFTIDEYFTQDRTESEWVADDEALQELWRKSLKEQFLRLRLAGKSDAEAKETILKRYKELERRTDKTTSDDVFSIFMRAFTMAIEPHTAYFSPKQAEEFQIAMSLSLVGIGAILEPLDEYTTVQSLSPAGPADRQGTLKAGDRIVGVGQGHDSEVTNIVGWRLDDVVRLIRGEKGTIARLEILGKGKSSDSPTIFIEILREELKFDEQSAKSNIIELPGKGSDNIKIGVITLPSFYIDWDAQEKNDPEYKSCARDVKNLIEELKTDGIDGLIIDLRDNGGGSLTEVTVMAGLFIDEGPVVQSYNGFTETEVLKDDVPGTSWDGPLAVMVNRYSASASEIFAATIQDYGRGIIVGETTYGKGTVQQMIDLSYAMPYSSVEMGHLKMTSAQFYRVNGGSTQLKGVSPDISFLFAGNPDEYGESDYPNSLPWNMIDSAKYEKVADISTLLASLERNHVKRIMENSEFMDLSIQMKELDKVANSEQISLLEARRKSQLEKLKIDDTESDKKSDKNEPDVFEVETANIVSDMISANSGK